MTILTIEDTNPPLLNEMFIRNDDFAKACSRYSSGSTKQISRDATYEKVPRSPDKNPLTETNAIMNQSALIAPLAYAKKTAIEAARMIEDVNNADGVSQNDGLQI